MLIVYAVFGVCEIIISNLYLCAEFRDDISVVVLVHTGTYAASARLVHGL